MDSERSRTPLQHLLSLFTEVKAGEATPTLLMSIGVFLLLTSYYIMKPVREALILAGSGAEVKSYAAAVQFVILLGGVSVYAKVASRYSRRKLINVVTSFFILCLGLFYLLAQLHTPYLGVIFFVWIGIFNVVVIAQFWAFVNDVHSVEEGERLFPLIALGANLGAIFGSVITSWLIIPLGVNQLLFVAAAFLALSLWVVKFVDTRKHQPGRAASSTAAEVPIGGGGVFRLLQSNRYLLLIALLILFLNWVNTNGEYILGRLITQTAKDAVAAGTAGGIDVGQYIGKFYADFFSVVNVLTLLIQLFLVSRIIKYIGIRYAVLFLPLIALGSYSLLIFFPVLGFIRWVKTAENSTDYSLQNTVRHALFLPTTQEEKYKAKQVTDSLFWRIGDVFSAGVVALGTAIFTFQTMHFAMVNALLVLIWLVIAVAIGRQYQRKSAEFGT